VNASALSEDERDRDTPDPSSKEQQQQTSQGPSKPAKTVKGQFQSTALLTNPRMKVEKAVVNELLLVCGVIGSTTDDKTNKIVPVTDCLNWLQDLQRALRRDDDTYRPISLLLGKWKVVSQKLLPLVWSCRYDTPLVLTIVKILVILTKPLSAAAKKAGRLVIDVKSGKVPEDVIQGQIKLRDNALEQNEMLVDYKRTFVHHPSHIAKSKSGKGGPGAKKSPRGQDDKQEEGGGLLSIFVSLLAEPLSKTGTERTDADHLTIELVLHLFRNLLSAEPIMTGTAEKSCQSAVLHQELISLFERELVLDVFLVLAQELESRENAQYNLLLMEILHHLLRTQDPTQVARITSAIATKSNAPAIEKVNKGQGPAISPSRTPLRNTSGPPASTGSLRAQLKTERQNLRAAAHSRHSHFGGTLVVTRPGGRRQYVSASSLKPGGASAAEGGGDGISASAAMSSVDPPRRKNRKTEPFIGFGRSSASHTRQGAVISSNHEGGPVTRRAQQTLNNFCGKFVNKCYGPMMKSLKNEFRRDSVRLEESDKLVFFRIIWFFSQWWRVSRGSKSAQIESEGKKSNSAVGQLIFTMDMFTFNLVLNSTDNFHQRKKYSDLMQAVALYHEMMQLLQEMYLSKDSTEHVMALGLMDRLFYANEPLDRLPKLLSWWSPGTFTREYLCDLVELCHVTLKLLDTNSKSCQKDIPADARRKHKFKDKKKREEEERRLDAVERMKNTAAEFDVSSYFAKKIVSNQLVFMYTRLLTQYKINSHHINHHIVALFLRLCKFTIVQEDDGSGGANDMRDPGKILIGGKTVTLEPMLYNINLLTTLNDILHDVIIRRDKDYSSLLSFATLIMRHFARATESNPMLFIECLFRHPAPHRFCELSTNMYVSEELMMIAEREVLLEEQQKLMESQLDEVGEEDQMHESSEEMAPDNDEEVEFGGDGDELEETNIDSDIVATDNAGAEQEDKDPERWNGRRKFIPKRKRRPREDVDGQLTLDESSSPSSVKHLGQEDNISSDRVKRSKILRKKFATPDIPSDGEEEFVDNSASINPARLVFDDDE